MSKTRKIQVNETEISVMITPIRAKRNLGSCQPLLAEEEVPEVYLFNKALFCA